MIQNTNIDVISNISTYLTLSDIIPLLASNKHMYKSVKYLWIEIQKRWFPMSILTKYSDIRLNSMLYALYSDQLDLDTNLTVSILNLEIDKFKLQNRNNDIERLTNFRANTLCYNEYSTNKRQIREIERFVDTNHEIMLLDPEQSEIYIKYRDARYLNFIVLNIPVDRRAYRCKCDKVEYDSMTNSYDTTCICMRDLCADEIIKFNKTRISNMKHMYANNIHDFDYDSSDFGSDVDSD
jgi:hypothetical protein